MIRNFTDILTCVSRTRQGSSHGFVSSGLSARLCSSASVSTRPSPVIPTCLLCVSAHVFPAKARQSSAFRQCVSPVCARVRVCARGHVSAV